MTESAAGSQLAQARASASAATLFSASMRTEITRIFVTNTTTSSATFRLYHDDDGSTYDESTALFWDATVEGKSTVEIVSDTDNGGIVLAGSGNLGMYGGTDLALTFTVYGVTEQAFHHSSRITTS